MQDQRHARPGWLTRWSGSGQAAAPLRQQRWPAPCALCGRWDRGAACGDCRLRFAAAVPGRCPRCALPGSGGLCCGACLRQPPPYSRCTAALDYGFPWDRLIRRFKFQSQPELAGLLAGLLADALRAEDAGLPDAAAAATAVDWVLPVPLGPARLAERGYNQAWELARRVAAQRGLAADAGLLRRLRDTPQQVGLDRQQRARNLRDAFWVAPAATRQLAGRRIALVDDVLTTGGTAAAASLALLAAGAAEVRVWVLARTPAPGG